MAKVTNPFFVKGTIPAAYFCDREQEAEKDTNSTTCSSCYGFRRNTAQDTNYSDQDLHRPRAEGGVTFFPLKSKNAVFAASAEAKICKSPFFVVSLHCLSKNRQPLPTCKAEASWRQVGVKSYFTREIPILRGLKKSVNKEERRSALCKSNRLNYQQL